MNLFEQKFSQLLEQGAVEEPLALGPDVGAVEEPVSDEEAFAGQLDSGTGEEDFDVSQPEVTPEDAIKQQNAAMEAELQEWISRMEEFAGYLNGLEEDSIQSKLNNASCDTLFAKIASSETKKVSRVAQDLRSVVEALKSYMLSSDNK